MSITRGGGTPSPASTTTTATTTPAATTPAPASVGPAAGRPRSLDRFERGAPRTLEVMFTPHEDALSYEARCLDEVIAARKADPATYTDAENPYRVRYMVFNLRNKEIIDKLTEAARAGVNVQVLVEADQIAADRPWNKVAEWFQAQGLSVMRSDKGSTADERARTHLVGVDKNALMHMKARIFHFKDPATGEQRSRVLSGSLNPNGAPVLNDENLHAIHDERVVAQYDKRFEQVRDRLNATNEWFDDRPINVLFTPYDNRGPSTPTRKLFEWIDQEKELILVSVFQLHDLEAPGVQETLVQKLKAAQERGVKVMAITDRRKSDGLDDKGNPVKMYGRPVENDPTDEALAAAGIPVFELVNTSSEFAAVHGKSVLFGLTDMKVMTDAGNWTVAAMGDARRTPTNDESFLFIDSGKLDNNATGQAYLSNFIHLLRKYDNQFPEEAADVVRDMQAMPAWPKAPVDLAAVARANSGAEVFLVSDHPDVKARTPAGAPGMPVPATLPVPPLRPAEPLRLPLGTMLTYRVVERDPASNTTRTSGDQVLVVEGE